MNDSELANVLHGLMTGRITEKQLSGLVHRAIVDASTIILSRFRRYLPILRNSGYTLEAAASRCIENLVLPHDGQPCYKLAEFLRNEADDGEAQANANSIGAFRRVLFLQISQQIPELLGEFDSPYKRILRLVSRCLRQNPAMQKLEGFLEDHYYRGDSLRILQTKPRMPLDSLVGELFVLTTDTDHIAQLVAHIFDILDDQAEYRRTLTRGDMVEIIRDFHAMRWQQSSIPAGVEMSFDVGDRDRLLNPTVEQVRHTVVQSYLNKQVLDEDSADKYVHAVATMLSDLSNNSPLSWYVYYEREFNGQSYEKYRAEERHRFEYVMGFAKKNFISRCREYFSV